MQSVEVKFLRDVEDFSIVDKIKSVEIRKMLKIESIINKTKQHRQQWKEHLLRLEEVLNFTPKRERQKAPTHPRKNYG